MAVKTFTTGEVLTSTDTNTYLTNSGLVYVKSQTIGTGVTSVTVSSAFSATYDNYKIQWSGTSSLATGNGIEIQMGATVTGYYGTMIYSSYVGTIGVVGDNNAGRWTHCAGANQNQILLDADIFNPFKAQITSMATSFYADNANAGKKSGWLNNTTSYTSFTLFAGTGTLTGGTIIVYGYRKA